MYELDSPRWHLLAYGLLARDGSVAGALRAWKEFREEKEKRRAEKRGDVIPTPGVPAPAGAPRPRRTVKVTDEMTYEQRNAAYAAAFAAQRGES